MSATPALFAGKNILIFGATSGIGRATALAFAGAGAASLTLTGRRADKGAEVVAAAEAIGVLAQFVQGDVTDEDHIRAAVAAVGKFGPLHVAFNNAGIEGEQGPITEVAAETFDEVFAVNVRGVLLGMKHEVPALLAAGGGVIINNTSILGQIAFPGSAVYAASKDAVVGLTKSAALEYGRAGIRVNSIAPGPIATNMLDQFAGGDTSWLAAANPMGRIGQVEEIAAAALFLASDGCKFLNGHELIVDGGFMAWTV
jgi:NAD(P)-dependent dehydrogenase (short-subunit alcohol dehydrogenase family)